MKLPKFYRDISKSKDLGIFGIREFMISYIIIIILFNATITIFLALINITTI